MPTVKFMRIFKYVKDTFYYLKYFHIPYRKLHLLLWHFQNEEFKSVGYFPASIKQLDFLNDLRASIQIEIGKILKNYDTCEKCKGKCCYWAIDMFRVFDSVLRKHSNNPIKDYTRISKPRSNVFLLTDFLKSSFSKLGLYQFSNSSQSQRKCRHLTEKGCIFPYKDRPIDCVLYTCRPLIANLTNNDFIRLAALTKVFESIAHSIIKLYQKERNLGT